MITVWTLKCARCFRVWQATDGAKEKPCPFCGCDTTEAVIMKIPESE